MKLLGVGKARFQKLNQAARKGEEWCPYDARFMMREKKAPSKTWEAVHTFLTQLYMEAAEPIPDGLNSNKRPRHGVKKIDSPNLERSQIKHLPYGSINDYWRQCVDANPGLKIGRKLFCSASQPNFANMFKAFYFCFGQYCFRTKGSSFKPFFLM